MINGLPLINPNHYEICMFSALLAVGFHGLFRLEELLKNFLSIRLQVKRPLFVKLDGSPLFTKDVANILMQLALFLNLLHNLIKPHSLRIRGSTHLHLQGWPHEVIQERGCWSLDTCKRYIRC